MLLRRLKNLWELSNFKITEFDNQLVITRKAENLEYARPQMAQIIRKKVDVIEEIVN